MELRLDHGCRKELTLAERDEDERDKAVQSQFGGVNKMYGIFRSSHPRTTHAPVTTNEYSLHYRLASSVLSFLFKIYIVPCGFVCSVFVSQRELTGAI